MASAIDGRGALRRGIKRGNQGGGVNTLMGHLEASSGEVGMAGSGENQRRCGRS
jgi:hypothetical protein